tara:strand:- start:11071 stop:11586 length:516 start_codon:yes stop_codon:yes gene_type:complete
VALEKNKKASRKKSPFEHMMENFLSGNLTSTNDIPVEHFGVLLDCFVHYFYGKGDKNKSSLETLTDFDGLKTEFDRHTLYPYVKKDRSETNFKIIVLPEKSDSEEDKQSLVFRAIKEFDCLENLQIYQLILKIIQHYDEKQLIEFIKKYDPISRDNTATIEFLKKRKHHRK